MRKLLALSALLLSACGSAPPAPAPTAGEATLAGRRLRVSHVTSDALRGEAADTLTGLGDDQAMLLSWNRPRFLHLYATRAWGHTFDVAFLGADGRITSLQPLSGESDRGITSEAESCRALILPPGFASRAGVKAGLQADLSAGIKAAAVEPMPVVRVDGHEVHVEVSHRLSQRQRGLMHRPRMSADDGMLFVYHEPSERSFWMGFTLIPLDIAYFGADGSLINVCRARVYADPAVDTEPKAPSAGQAQFVLEVNLGWFDRRKLIDPEGRPVKRVLLELPDAVRQRVREAE